MTPRTPWWLVVALGCTVEDEPPPTVPPVEDTEPPAPAEPTARLVLPPDGIVRVVAPPRCEGIPAADWQPVGAVWEADGVLVGGDADGPPPGTYARGTELRCVFTFARPAGDDTDERDLFEARSELVAVYNTPPTILAVHLTPNIPLGREPVTCRGEWDDADGDPVTLTYRWERAGAGISDTPLLAPPQLPGDELWCVITPHDGLDDGESGRVSVRIADPPTAQNVLVVLLDDVGIEQIGASGLGAGAAPTPTIDALAAEGVRFSHAYSQPVCSPTRAALLTGRPPHRTGIGSQVKFHNAPWSLQADELTIAEALEGHGYHAAAFGKWHLDRRAAAGRFAPMDVGGFHWFEGFDDNLLANAQDGQPQDYFSWEMNRNGSYERIDSYNTSWLATAAVEHLTATPEPWFAYVALAAAHKPTHTPPERLTSGGPSNSRDQMYDRMLEAADTELGRLLDALDPAVRARTTIVIAADNGSADDIVEAPFDGSDAKGEVGEAGVRVPLIIVSPATTQPGRVVDHLVQISDLYSTVLDLAGVEPAPELAASGDAISLLPYLVDPDRDMLRSFVTADRFEPLGLTGPYEFRDRMLRDDRYKLIVRTPGRDSFYDLQTDPYEAVDLLRAPALTQDQEAALAALRDQADRYFVP